MFIFSESSEGTTSLHPGHIFTLSSYKKVGLGLIVSNSLVQSLSKEREKKFVSVIFNQNVTSCFGSEKTFFFG